MKKLVFQATFLFCFFVFCSFLSILPVFASEFTAKVDIDFPSNQDIFSNIYLTSRSALLSSNFQEDLVSLSLSNFFKGNGKKDLALIGAKNEVSGKVSGDLRLVGGVNLISAEVSGDLMVVGAKVIIKKEAKILGDVFILAGEFFSEADLNSKKIKIVSVNSNLNSKIDSPLEITAQKLSLGPNTQILNKFDYYSPVSYEISDKTKIAGPVSFHRIPYWNETGTFKSVFLSLVSFWLILKLVTTTFLVFILVNAFRVFTQTIMEKSIVCPGKSLLWGIAFAVCAPILAVFFIISLIALPVGLVLILFGFFTLIISPALASIFVGFLIKKIYFHFKKINKKIEINFLFSFFGVLVILALQFIPYVGNALKIILAFIVVGALISYYLNLMFARKNQ